MKIFVSTNLNSKIRFKITPYGKTLPEVEPYLKTFSKDEDGFYSTELWAFASIFGPELYNGCVIPVETSVEIEINS